MKEKFTLVKGDDSFVEIEYPLTIGNPRVYYQGTEYLPVNTGANLNRGLAFDIADGRLTIKLESYLWMSYIGIRFNGKQVPNSPAAPINRVRPAAYMAWLLALVIVAMSVYSLFIPGQPQNRGFELLMIGFGIGYALLGWGVFKLNHACSMTLFSVFLAHSVWGIINGGLKFTIIFLIIIWFFLQGLLATRDNEREKLDNHSKT